MHIDESILDENNAIDPFKLNIVSRLGSNWYGKTTKESLYEIVKPISRIGMGIDNLPENIRNSKILTGNELAILASTESIPDKGSEEKNLNTTEKHQKAKQLLQEGKSEEAWQISKGMIYAVSIDFSVVIYIANQPTQWDNTWMWMWDNLFG